MRRQTNLLRGFSMLHAMALSALLIGAHTAQAVPARVEALGRLGDWKASGSDQVKAALRKDARDGSLCLDYDFGSVSGYAVMRRELPLDWPEHFQLQLRLKGQGARNDLQLKFVDASGDNVWWINRPDMALPAQLTPLRFKRRHVDFAWGPTSDKRLRQTAAIELVMAAGREGGKGSACLAGLDLAAQAAPPAVAPPVVARARHGDARAAIDGDAATDWRLGGAGAQRLLIDAGMRREFNGLSLQWGAEGRATDYRLSASDDGRRWRLLRRVRGGGGALDTLFLPETEARYLRLDIERSSGTSPALAELRWHDAARWPSVNAMLSDAAAALPLGELPRAFRKQQNYWTLVGVDGASQRSALVSEDGAIEIGRGGPSVEPVLRRADGRYLHWASARIEHRLRDGYLPMPVVHWAHEDLSLDIEAAAEGSREAPQLLARYTVHNRSPRPQTLDLMLALRPWQVNPPQQFLSTPGGVRPVRTLGWSGGELRVDGAFSLRPLQTPDAVRAQGFDAGLGLEALWQAPALTQLRDPQGLASGALVFRLTLAPGERRQLGWTAPLGPVAAGAPQALPQTLDAAALDARFEAVAAHWRERLNRLQLQLPAQAGPIADSLRTALAHMLISRDGPALRPGTRSYARTWVRDGAMMVAGLLPLGERDASREFIDWYAPKIFANGKVPCCVDQRGADPVVENDSHGQYLFTVAELWRHTGDRALLARHWPTVQRVVAYMESLRQSERGAENRQPERVRFFGLMPPSISHEGYSDKAAYSNWDNFWALRGYKDAVLLAEAMGDPVNAARWSGWRDEFQREFAASIAATAAHYGMNVVAGAADRGDVDPTSTTMALNPAQAEDMVPAGLLRQTFERYWQESLARAEGRRASPDYTPYELRSVGALVRLGEVERAHAMLDFFFKDQRPAGWNQWAEVVLPNPREVRFLGDMPHAWVSSDYVRSALDLLAYEVEADRSLVLGAGLKLDWLEGEGVAVAGMSTPYGPLGYSLRRKAEGWQFELAPGLRGLSGGVRLRWPGLGPLPEARHPVTGQVLAWSGRDLRLPADVGRVLLQRLAGR